jgi:hypothetical protein
MIPPPAQRSMASRAGASVTETPGSHAVYVSRPAAVAAIIARAAAGAPATAAAKQARYDTAGGRHHGK